VEREARQATTADHGRVSAPGDASHLRRHGSRCAVLFSAHRLLCVSRTAHPLPFPSAKCCTKADLHLEHTESAPHPWLQPPVLRVLRVALPRTPTATCLLLFLPPAMRSLIRARTSMPRIKFACSPMRAASKARRFSRPRTRKLRTSARHAWRGARSSQRRLHCPR